MKKIHGNKQAFLLVSLNKYTIAVEIIHETLYPLSFNLYAPTFLMPSVSTNLDIQTSGLGKEVGTRPVTHHEPLVLSPGIWEKLMNQGGAGVVQR